MKKGSRNNHATSFSEDNVALLCAVEALCVFSHHFLIDHGRGINNFYHFIKDMLMGTFVSFLTVTVRWERIQ